MVQQTDNADVIKSMQDQIDGVLSDVIGGAKSFALVDFPDHNNVGDSAIYLGELEYLQRFYGTRPAYVCRADRCDYERLATRFGDALILIHGGGNFGDIWPWHHGYREALLNAFPGRKIVQLAQTIQFDSDDALARTKSAIERHGNFVLLVRDARSYALAKRAFDCTVIACPDMAFWMGPLPRLGRPTHELLLLLRDDHERAAELGESHDFNGPQVIVDDWSMDHKILRAIQKIITLVESIVLHPHELGNVDALRVTYFERLARRRVRRGLKLLSSGKFIITDRLHAYILAQLLDIPRLVVDNSYGKISGFVNTWIAEPDAAPTFKRLNEAIAAWQATQLADSA